MDGVASIPIRIHYLVFRHDTLGTLLNLAGFSDRLMQQIRRFLEMEKPFSRAARGGAFHAICGRSR